MDDNFTQINDFYEKYKNTLVLDNHKVVILRAWTDDIEDYYYILQDPHDGTFYKLSCVIDPVVLKGKIDQRDYDQLKSEIKHKLDRLNQEID